MIDSGEGDAKILAVQTKNPRLDSLKDITDMEAHNNHLLKEIAHFFKVYKDLQGKEVEIAGWGNAEEAREEIRKSQKLYSEQKV